MKDVVTKDVGKQKLATAARSSVTRRPVTR